MSYDLTMVALGEGEGLDEIFARMELEESLALPSIEMRAVFSSIARELAADGYEYVEGEKFVNIVNDDFGAVVDLQDQGAEINVAYWHSGGDAATVMQSIVELVDRIRRVTGWTVFDPQRGEIVTDLAPLVAQSSGEMDRITRWADQNIRGAKRPWWKFWG